MMTRKQLGNAIRAAFLERDGCVRTYDRAKRESGPPTTTNAYADLVATEKRINALVAQIARTR